VLVIFLFYTCNVHSQTIDTTDPSDSTSNPSSITTASTFTSNDTTTEETDSNATTNATDFIDTTNPTDFTITTTIISSTTTITNTSGGCYPDGFPFFNDCISPNTNGIIVITAFSLSILSFIGVIVNIEIF
jgi:hypothetical protein